ncbi:MAG: nuclear transport factor 2 family protein [Gammaproteobacteria bacterium]
MEMQELIDEHQIRKVIYRYCRGIDRRDFDLVRGCYHPGATDDHANYKGDVDGFIAYVQKELPRFEQTMHTVANVLIEVDGDVAWSEAYTLAYHRLPASRSKPQRDYSVGLRYVDRFERRDGRWAIADRKCVFSWSRLDPVPEGHPFGPAYPMGAAAPADPAYRR